MIAQIFQVTLTCPSCGRNGTARWEDKSVGTHGPARELVGLSEGFSSRDVGHGPVEIICTSCKVPHSPCGDAEPGGGSS